MVQRALSEQPSKYDILLGHSQGAILIASMLANKDLTKTNTPPTLILNGVAWPNPYVTQLNSLKHCHKPVREQQDSLTLGDGTRALFIIGENDDINPPEGAMQVREALQNAGIEVSSIFHPGGHSLPTKNVQAIQSIAQWISSSTQVIC